MRNQEDSVGKSKFSVVFTLTANCLFVMLEGRKKIKDGKDGKKKRGHSSEEDSTGTVRANKKKKHKGSSVGNNASGTTSGGVISTSGEGSYHVFISFQKRNYFC